MSQIRSIYYFLYGGIAIITASSSSAQTVPDLPDMTGAVVSTTIEELSPGALQYSYTLDNGSGSLAVNFLSFPILIDGGRTTGIDGLDNSAERLSANAQRRSLGDIVGVTFPSVPTNWVPALTPVGEVLWGAFSSSALVSQGSTLGGFDLQSRALPGIRQIRIAGDDLALRPTMSELSALGLSVVDLRIEHEDSNQLVDVVAPVAPMNECAPQLFLANIDSLRTSARSHGWISTSALDTALSSEIQTVDAALVAGNIPAAKAASTAFLGLVDAEACPPAGCTGSEALSPEGFALMKFNMEFLSDRLIDADGDLTVDKCDSCLAVSQPSQLDADQDGYGNYCDADYDQDGGTQASDFASFLACLGQAVPGVGNAEDPTCAETDGDGDLNVAAADFAIFLSFFATAPPGPSGLECANPLAQQPVCQ